MNVLFMDDDPGRRAAFLERVPSSFVVDNAMDCIKALSEKPWDVVFLDHDLGGEVYVDTGREDCGMEVVRWMEDNLPIVGSVIVHSLNGPASKEMVNRLDDANYNVTHIPFAWVNETVLKLVSED